MGELFEPGSLQEPYPILWQKKPHHRFRAHLEEFWRRLVHETKASGLLLRPDPDDDDDDAGKTFLDVFLERLVLISASDLRPLRHTAAVIAYAVRDALAEVAEGVDQDIRTKQEQLAAARERAVSPRWPLHRPRLLTRGRCSLPVTDGAVVVVVVVAVV